MTDGRMLAFPLRDDEVRSADDIPVQIRTIQALCTEEKHVTPTVPDDKRLFRRFFILDREPQYGKSWAYLTQAVNGHRFGKPLGLKYHRENILVPIGYFPRPSADESTWHFHVVRPMGNWRNSTFLKLCERLHSLSGNPVYVKKVATEEANWLLEDCSGFKPIDEYPWHPVAVEEDDTFAEVTVDTDHTLRLVEMQGANEVKDHYRRFLKRYRDSVEWKPYSPDLQTEARAVIREFFDMISEKPVQLSIPDDYENMIASLPSGENGEDYFAHLLYIEGQRAGFCLAERLYTGAHAGVYAYIALHECFPYSSEYLIVELIRRMQSAGISTVNFGGSETEGLDRFKRKFRPVRQEKMHWVVYET